VSAPDAPDAARVLQVRNAAGRVVEVHPDFEPGQPVRITRGVRDDGNWVFDGPARHPYAARVRNVALGITVDVERRHLQPRGQAPAPQEG